MPDSQHQPPVTFECRVARLEVNSDSDAEDQLKWSMKAYPVGSHPTPLVVIMGHLFSVKDGHWAQVLVNGFLGGSKSIAKNDRAAKNFVKRHIHGFTEEMYDVARRTLNLNAALMDIDLDLPVTAPRTEVVIANSEDFEIASNSEPLPSEDPSGDESHAALDVTQ